MARKYTDDDLEGFEFDYSTSDSSDGDVLAQVIDVTADAIKNLDETSDERKDD